MSSSRLSLSAYGRLAVLSLFQTCKYHTGGVYIESGHLLTTPYPAAVPSWDDTFDIFALYALKPDKGRISRSPQPRSRVSIMDLSVL